MHNCPGCRSDNVHRSHTRSKWESLRKRVTGKRPYRCHACGWRGWGIDLGPRFVDDAPEVAAQFTAAEAEGLKVVRGRRGISDAELSRIDDEGSVLPRKRG